jgi:hypothetical protein
MRLAVFDAMDDLVGVEIADFCDALEFRFRHLPALPGYTPAVIY